MERVERELRDVPGVGARVGRAARGILDVPGKRLRPLCVVLASRLGRGLGDGGIDLAVAAELLHGATLLHDDVIDEGEERRGRPAPRMIVGNAASVLAGDWLLTEALRRVRRSGHPELLAEVVEMLSLLVEAEALQLDGRDGLEASEDRYFRVVDGKTAALFVWAIRAGATAGGLDEGMRDALARFARGLGVAFQLVDDLLDYAGDAAAMGKGVFADLEEGKVTYPLLVGLARDPSLRRILEAARERERLGELGPEVRARLERTGALERTRDEARRRVAGAVRELQALPDGPARFALGALAGSLADRAS
jgi:octaprenyl-diphosphate synthase